MISSNKLLKFAAGLGVIVLVSIASALYVGFNLFEVENVKQGSIAYYLGLPSAIRSIPSFEECQAPIYRWRGRDGESSPYISWTYKSRGSLQKISDFYKNTFAQHSCSAETTVPVLSNEKNHIQFNCQGSDIFSVNVWIENESACRSVTLDIIESY